MADDFDYRFSSEYFDTETGLVYYNYRYYSLELGRWLSRDPIAERGSFNLYEMVENDSINRWDYLGLATKKIIIGYKRVLRKVRNTAYYQGQYGYAQGHMSRWVKIPIYKVVQVPDNPTCYTDAADVKSPIETAVDNYDSTIDSYWDNLKTGNTLKDSYIDYIKNGAKSVTDLGRFGTDISDEIYNGDGDWLDKASAMSKDFSRGGEIIASGVGLGGHAKGANKAIKAAAKKAGITDPGEIREFGKYVEQIKRIEGRGGADHLSFKRLKDIAKEYLGQ
jgi:RHS repeat-associated protein